MNSSVSNQLITEDDALEIAYDLFLEGASEHLGPADQIIFSLQFEQCGAAEVIDVSEDWQQQLNREIDSQRFCEVVIGLAEDEDAELKDIFARILISRDLSQPFSHIIWRQ